MIDHINEMVEAYCKYDSDRLEVKNLFWVIEDLIKTSVNISKDIIQRLKYIHDNLKFLFEKIKIVENNKKHLSISIENLLSLDDFDLIQEFINNYLLGHQVKAYLLINKWLSSSNIVDNLLWQVNQNKYFYRCRNNYKNQEYDILDLFHVPFQLRHLVSNSRFSISGFPSLYLGSSILTCIEELGNTKLNELSVIAISPIKKWNLLDLRLYKEINSKKQLKGYLKNLPILISCAIPKADREGSFHSEYILPQAVASFLLTQRHKIHGIVYCSTRINNDYQLFYGFGESYHKYLHNFNVVLPVITNEIDGYCPLLASKMKCGKPCSFDHFLIDGFNSNPIVKKKFESELLKKWENYLKRSPNYGLLSKKIFL